MGGPPWGLSGKESTCQAGDVGFIPGWRRSPVGGLGSHHQCSSCLENLMDRGIWQATVHRITRSWTRLSNSTYTHASTREALLSSRGCFVPLSLSVTQSCLTPYSPKNWDPPGFCVHGVSRLEYRSGFPFPSPGLCALHPLLPGDVYRSHLRIIFLNA